MPKVTIAISRKISDNAYGSFEATIGLEDEVPKGTNKDSHAAATRAWVKAFLDETLGDLRKEYLSQEPIARPAMEELAGEVEEAMPGISRTDVPHSTGYVEEQPPTPEEMLGLPLNPGEKPPPGPLPGEASQTQTLEADASLPSVPEEIRTPIDEAGNELKSFVVKSIEIAETANGDKFGKVYGGPWKREWVPAWDNVMDTLFGDIENMDLGMILPPYAVTALVKMGEYKGKPSPDSVVEWKRIP